MFMDSIRGLTPLGRWVAALTCATLFALSALAVIAASADAVSASCSAVIQKKVRDGAPDHWRARTTCTRIGGDTKVRSKLVRDGATDIHSSFFTGTYEYHYTSWAPCAFGCYADYDPAER